MPTEPPPTRWRFPAARAEEDLVAIGADLEPGTLLAAYRAGIFPMPVSAPGAHVLAWWSPDPRGIIPVDGVHVSRSLARSRRRFEIRINTAFEDVLDACAQPRPPGVWITRAIRQAYTALHELGWAHSVEAWSLEDGTLAGGLYGVAIGGFFSGESMFYRARDASKVALVALAETLGTTPGALLDAQWTTDHLVSLGAVEVPRDRYLDLLTAAIEQPLPEAFAR